MFDRWKLKDFAPGEGRSLGAFTEHFTMDDEWIDISAPGDVYQALTAAGRIQNPFYDRNELACAWIPSRPSGSMARTWAVRPICSASPFLT